MSKLDERTPLPPLDAAARRRLATALERDGVVAAFVFGSRAGGRVTPLSDIDVAVWLDPALSTIERARRRLDLADAACRALGTGEVDVVVLNDATPLLRHRAVGQSSPLLDRDPRLRVRLETEALLQYLDTAPLREILAAGRRQRLAEGTYGRR